MASENACAAANNLGSAYHMRIRDLESELREIPFLKDHIKLLTAQVEAATASSTVVQRNQHEVVLAALQVKKEIPEQQPPRYAAPHYHDPALFPGYYPPPPLQDFRALTAAYQQQPLQSRVVELSSPSEMVGANRQQQIVYPQLQQPASGSTSGGGLYLTMEQLHRLAGSSGNPFQR